MNSKILKMEIINIEIETGGKFGEGKKTNFKQFHAF